MRIVAVVA